MPLVQVFGHVEAYLQHPEFYGLAEMPAGQQVPMAPIWQTWSLCPLKPEAQEFAVEMTRQMCEAHPNAHYMHIGADEVYQLGTCPECQAFLETHTKSELYLRHINLVAQVVVDCGKVPVIWSDYLAKYPENLAQLHPSVVPMYWIYDSMRTDQLPLFTFFNDLGHRVMGAPSLSSDFTLMLPNYDRRLPNVATQAWCTFETGNLGVATTSWVVCACPLDTQIPGIAVTASYLWNPRACAPAPGSHEVSLDLAYLNNGLYHHVFQVPPPVEAHFLELLMDAGLIGPGKLTVAAAAKPLVALRAEVEDLLPRVPHNAQVTLQALDYALRCHQALVTGETTAAVLLEVMAPYDEAADSSAPFYTPDALRALIEDLEWAQEDLRALIREADEFFERTGRLHPRQITEIFEAERYQRRSFESLDRMRAKIQALVDAIDDLLLSTFQPLT
jgi:hypothetical protein